MADEEIMLTEEDFEPDILSLLDDEGTQHNFEILDGIETEDGTHYLALLPVFDDPQKNIESDGMYYIFEVFDEDGEEQLQEVEDEALAEELAAIFEERFASYDAMELEE